MCSVLSKITDTGLAGKDSYKLHKVNSEAALTEQEQKLARQPGPALRNDDILKTATVFRVA